MSLTEQVESIKRIPGGLEWLERISRYVEERPWIKVAKRANWNPVWLRDPVGWANAFWPTKWPGYRKDRFGNDNNFFHDRTFDEISLALVYLGCPEGAAKADALNSWAGARQYAKQTGAFIAELGEMKAKADGFIRLETPWLGGFYKYVPAGWSTADWATYVPLRQISKRLLSFVQTANGYWKPNFTWETGGPTREWLWERRPDLRGYILRCPLNWPTFRPFDPRLHQFRGRAEWEAWRDQQLSLLPDNAVPFPGYVSPGPPPPALPPAPPDEEPELPPEPELRADILSILDGINTLLERTERLEDLFERYL